MRTEVTTRHILAALSGAWLCLLWTGCTTYPLHDAIKANQTATAMEMIKAGKYVNDVDNAGFTPLMWASYRGKADVVNALLAAGANTCAVDCHTGLTAMILAAGQGHTEIMCLLLDSGDNVGRRLKDGGTAINVAAQNGREKSVRALLDRGADVNEALSDGTTPLSAAALNGHIAIVQVLLQHSAPADRKLTNGETPLMMACARGHAEIAKMLVGAGADVNATTASGLKPLDCAASRILRLQTSWLAQFLLEAGATPGTCRDNPAAAGKSLGIYAKYLRVQGKSREAMESFRAAEAALQLAIRAAQERSASLEKQAFATSIFEPTPSYGPSSGYQRGGIQQNVMTMMATISGGGRDSSALQKEAEAAATIAKNLEACVEECRKAQSPPVPVAGIPTGRLDALVEPSTKRTYYLYVPTTYDPERTYPLVVTAHGDGAAAGAKAERDFWADLAERYGLIVCAAEMESAKAALDLPKDRPAPELLRDEQACMAIVRQVASQYKISRGAVLMTGVSSGAYAAHFIGLRHPEIFRCIVTRSGHFDERLVADAVAQRARHMHVYLLFGEGDPPDIAQMSRDANYWYTVRGFHNAVIRLMSGANDPNVTETARYFLGITNYWPDVHIEASAPQGQASLEVTFRARVHDPDSPEGRVDSVLWNFGDKTVSSKPEVTHTYAAAGIYNVVLIVADLDGHREYQQAWIRVGLPPKAPVPTAPQPSPSPPAK
jgi:ankyrin repeat protein/poly(3-hydroxybutyrate) depolymerase